MGADGLLHSANTGAAGLAHCEAEGAGTSQLCLGVFFMQDECLELIQNHQTLQVSHVIKLNGILKILLHTGRMLLYTHICPI